MIDKLPPPDCPQGYPHSQLERIFDKQELARLHLWMNGQTQSICDGRSYNHEKKCYEKNACTGHPHGTVLYAWDLESWLRAGDILD